MDAATLKRWTESLGFRVEEGPTRTGFSAVLPGLDDVRLTIEPTGEDVWTVAHSHRLSAASLRASMVGGQHGESPASVLTRTVHQVGNSMPLVRTAVSERARDVVIEFSAPLYSEDLNRQTFALTVSSVAKAVEVFHLVTAEQKKLAEEWSKIEAQSAQREKELATELERLRVQDEPSRPVAVAPPPVTVARERRCPNCGRMVPTSKKFCTGCGASMP
jgi:hypothetical protein